MAGGSSNPRERGVLDASGVMSTKYELWQPYRAMPKSPMRAKQCGGRALEVGESYSRGKAPLDQPEHRWHYS